MSLIEVPRYPCTANRSRAVDSTMSGVTAVDLAIDPSLS
jgi:hypothetical protein